MIIIIPGFIIALIAEAKIKFSYSKYSKISTSENVIASDAGRMLLERGGISDVVVRPTDGTLTDNYNPTDKTLNISKDGYYSNSVAAVAVAAHEVGHAYQDRDGYFGFVLRKILVPVTNFGSRLAIPLAIVGVVICWLSTNSKIGKYILLLAIIAYSLTTLFALITLPVEINASARAKKMLSESGIIVGDEMRGVSAVLNSAAMTYVAGLTVSFLYLLRFIVILLSLTGRSNRK